MRQVLVISSLVALAFAGCIDAPGVETAAADAALVGADGSIPAAFSVPLGSDAGAQAFHVRIGLEDWVEDPDSGYHWTRVVAEFEGIGKDDLSLFVAYEIDHDLLKWRGMSGGTGGRSGLGFGARAPEVMDLLLIAASDAKAGNPIVNIQKAKEFDDAFPADLPNARPVAEGNGTRASVFIDAGLPWSVTFQPYVHDVEVQDDRLAQLDVGALRLRAEHDLGTPMLRLGSGFAIGMANVGRYHFACTVDGDTEEVDTLRVQTLLTSVEAGLCYGGAQAASIVELDLEGIVGTAPFVAFQSVSLPIDAGSLGYRVEGDFWSYGILPVAADGAAFAFAAPGVVPYARG